MEAPAAVVPSVEVTPQKHHETHGHGHDHDAKPALTPPTSEDMDKLDDPMSSELSELDSDDDNEDIEPDHYFEGGKIPVFKPVRCAAAPRTAAEPTGRLQTRPCRVQC